VPAPAACGTQVAWLLIRRGDNGLADALARAGQAMAGEDAGDGRAKKRHRNRGGVGRRVRPRR